MLHGLPRKIRTAFMLQALLAGLAVLLGGYLVLLVVKFGLVNAVLQDEVTHYWELHAASPAQPPLAAWTKLPISEAARGASNSTGTWQVLILRAPRRASARRAA